jgi:hydrogenase 3 maturation protease
LPLSLKEELVALFSPSKNPVIICLGNELRGDDRVGIEIGMTLKDRMDFPVLLAHNVPVNYLGKITKLQPDLILFIDAIEAGMESGVILLFTPDEEVELSSFTTHYQEASVLLKFLEKGFDKLPPTYFLGIQIEDTELMSRLSESVEIAKTKVIDAFLGLRE